MESPLCAVKIRMHGESEWGEARDHPSWDVRHGSEAVLLGKDLLRDRDDVGFVADEEADRPDEIVGAPLGSLVLFRVRPRVLPRHQDDRRFRGFSDAPADRGEIDRPFHAPER